MTYDTQAYHTIELINTIIWGETEYSGKIQQNQKKFL